MFSVPLRAILLSVLIHALWGGNPIAGKFGLEVFPPFWSAFIRFVFGILTIISWCYFRGLRILPMAHEWKPIINMGLLFTVQIGLMNLGFDQTSGINASILIATNPLFAALFAHLLLKGDSLTTLRSVGLGLAFCGVCITLWSSSNASASFHFGSTGDWLCLASAMLLGYRLIASAQAMRTLDPFRLAIWQMVFSLPLYALAGITFENIRWERLNLSAVYGLMYQGVVVAGLGFMASLWLISRYQPSTMTSYNFISPVTGVLLAGWLLGDQITGHALTGTGLLAAGMIVLTLRPEAVSREG